MNTITFSIYTDKSGHQVCSFPAFDSGKNAFDQAMDYALETYNDPNDVPQLFLLTPVPINDVKKTPDEWAKIFNIEVIDPDGWRQHGNQRDYSTPITRSEFINRINESTIHEQDFVKL